MKEKAKMKLVFSAKVENDIFGRPFISLKNWKKEIENAFRGIEWLQVTIEKDGD